MVCDRKMSAWTWQGREYEIEELRWCFHQVSDPSDWKRPIDTILDCDRGRLRWYLAAIEFYTATPARVRDCWMSKDRFLFRVTADGYRAGQQGPVYK